MSIGNSGSFILTGQVGFSARISWAEEYSADSNLSYVKITKLEVMSGNYAGGVYYPNGTVKVDGAAVITMNSVAGSHNLKCTNKGTYYAVKAHGGAVAEGTSGAILHNADGTKSVEIALDMGLSTQSGNLGHGSRITGIKTVILTSIPRAATLDTVSCDTGFVGGRLTYQYSPKSTAHFLRLKISMEGGQEILSKDIGRKSVAQWTETVQFTKAQRETVYGSLSGAAKEAGILVCLLTYSDSGYSNQVGSVQSRSITLTVPEDSETKPTVSMVLSAVNDLGTAFAELYIQGKSKVSADVTAAGKFGATISAKVLSVDGIKHGSLVSGLLNKYDKVIVTVTATDSRGFTGQATQEITVLSYSAPRLSPISGESGIVCARCDSSGNLAENGAYLKIKVMRGYSYISAGGAQKNFCEIRYRHKTEQAASYGPWVTLLGKSADTDSVDSTPISGVCTDDKTSYLVQLAATDDVGESSQILTFHIPTDSVTYYERPGGRAVSFGGYVSKDDVLYSHWNVEIRADRILKIGETALTEAQLQALLSKL